MLNDKTQSIIGFQISKCWRGDKGGTLLEIPRDYMSKDHGLNDGLVVVKSAKLESARRIVESGVDHAVPVMHCTLLKFDREAFLKTMLIMMTASK